MRVAILGSTGSIGQQTLEVLRNFPDKFNVVALSGGKNTRLLAEQAMEFHPQAIHFQYQNNPSPEVNALLKDYQWLSLEEIASYPNIDIVVVATSSRIGLKPTLNAIKKRRTVALANKEVLVMAGKLVMSEAQKYGVDILPIDSEHSAIWQCLHGERKETIDHLILTASGGPFYNYSPDKLAAVTKDEALNHPTWKMGKKVTIDSATLMNKGMEIIEIHWLFQIPFEQIEVVIHPQSIVHSMVSFVDGSTKAQLSPPDMRLPIQYALFYPNRPSSAYLPKFNWNDMPELTFKKIEFNEFPCLNLAIEADKRGGTYPAVLAAADEVAVELFLAGQIGFLDIPRVIEDTLSHHSEISDSPSLEDILNIDAEARQYALEWQPR